MTRAARVFALALQEVNIDTDDHLVRDFGLRIPVVRWDDGEVVDEGNIEPIRLLGRLASGRIKRMSSER